MEFLILLGICIVTIGFVVWLMRGRSGAADDAGLARQAHAEAERQRNDMSGGSF